MFSFLSLGSAPDQTAAIVTPVHTSYVRGTQDPLLSYNMAYTANMPFITSSLSPFQWNIPNPGLPPPGSTRSSAQTLATSSSMITPSIVSSAPFSTAFHPHSHPLYASAPPLTATLLRECFPLPHHAQLRDALSRIVQIIDENHDVPPDDLLQFTRREDQSTFHCLFWSGGASPCGKSFNRKDRAIDHVWSHLGYRPYACRGGCGILDWFVPRPKLQSGMLTPTWRKRYTVTPSSTQRATDTHMKGGRQRRATFGTSIAIRGGFRRVLTSLLLPLYSGKVITVKNRTRHRRSSSCLKPSST